MDIEIFGWVPTSTFEVILAQLKERSEEIYQEILTVYEVLIQLVNVMSIDWRSSLCIMAEIDSSFLSF